MKNNLILSFLLIAMIPSIGFAQGEEKAVSEATKNTETWSLNHAYKVYQVARSLNDLEGAKNALLDLLVELPQNDSIVFELSTIYFQLQMYQSAAICATEVLKLDATNIAVLEIAAISFEKLGAIKRSVEYYEKLYLQTDDYNSLYKTSLFQFDLEQYGQALTNIDILLTRPESDESKVALPTTANVQKEYPIRALLLNIKGMIKNAQGDKEAAKINFEASLKVAPDFSTAQEYLKSLDN